MQSTNSKQNNGTNKLPKILVSSLSSYDIISGGNEIHPIVSLTVVLYNFRRVGVRKDEMTDGSYFFPLVLKEI